METNSAGPETYEEEIRDYAAAGATDGDIAVMLGCTVESLLNGFGAVLQQARADRRITLLTHQTKAAAKGNASMLIFLGKQELGQSKPTNQEKPRIPIPRLDYKMG